MRLEMINGKMLEMKTYDDIVEEIARAIFEKSKFPTIADSTEEDKKDSISSELFKMA